jgi:hypothetical protein
MIVFVTVVCLLSEVRAEEQLAVSFDQAIQQDSPTVTVGGSMMTNRTGGAFGNAYRFRRTDDFFLNAGELPTVNQTVAIW